MASVELSANQRRPRSDAFHCRRPIKTFLSRFPFSIFFRHREANWIDGGLKKERNFDSIIREKVFVEARVQVACRERLFTLC